MKELSIEEKARRYDEAIKRVEDIMTGKCETRFMFTEGLFEHIFPALKESEDERIMGNIIATIHLYYGEPLEDEAKEMVAWLEKQAGHAKFRDSIQVGDKVTRNKDGVLVNLSQLERVAKPAVKIEPKFKIGDTVTVKPMSCHGKVFKGEPFKIVDIIEDNYVSDDGKTYSISLQDGWELVEQKPAEWSSRDDSYFEELTEASGLNELQIEWLTEIKDRVLQQPKQEWSEQEQVRVNRIVACLENLNVADNDILLKDVAWLKSLRPQSQWKPSNEQMDAVKDAMDYLGCNTKKVRENLMSLYEQLKKL